MRPNTSWTCYSVSKGISSNAGNLHWLGSEPIPEGAQRRKRRITKLNLWPLRRGMRLYDWIRISGLTTDLALAFTVRRFATRIQADIPIGSGCDEDV